MIQFELYKTDKFCLEFCMFKMNEIFLDIIFSKGLVFT